MGLGGFFKGLGKGLLKAAPFAAMAIPGIGPLASAAIGAGIGGASAKVKGGGLKDVLLGAGMGAAGSKIPGLDKGLSPSGGFLSGLKQVGMNTIKDPGTLMSIGGGIASRMQKPGDTPSGQRGITRKEEEKKGKKRNGAIGGSAMFRSRDMSMPNLTNPIEQGANEFFASRGLPPRVPTAY